MSHLIKSTLALSLALLAPLTASGADLALDKGTMSLGGQISANIQTSGNASLVNFEITPTFGYFLSEKFEVFGGLNVDYQDFFIFSLEYAAVVVGGNYYTNQGSTVGYVGLVAEVGFVPGLAINPQLQGGVLIGLNEHLAIDVGIKAGVLINDGGGVLDIDLGAVGLRGFF